MGKSKLKKVADIWKFDMGNASDICSMYPSIELQKSKTYMVCIDDEKSLYLHAVETIKFSKETINFYDAEGNLLANFKRNEYKYFFKVGL